MNILKKMKMVITKKMIPTRQSIGGLGNLMFKQAYIIGQMLDGYVPDTYVQDYRYWEKHTDAIRKTFMSDVTGTIDDVALHIRRGDYLQASNFHLDLSTTDYYQKSIALFPGKTFIVFCKDNQGTDEEDRAWCTEFLKDLIPDDQWEFAEITNSETDDLNLMASCKHIIMANSTFSWWAAFLNPFEGKRIVTPVRWFTDGIQRVSLPPEWIQIQI